MKLELGGGTLVQPGFLNLDPKHGSDANLKRLAQDTPWAMDDGVLADGSVEHIRASHVMEHIPSGQPRIDVFNEAHRVLQLGGTFEVIVPGAVSREPGEMLGWWAIADPTHVSLWVPESFFYLDGTFAANADYGIKLWETLSMEVKDGWEIQWVGRPRK